LKYTLGNIAYYATYTQGILQFNPLKIKYVDESSFEARSQLVKKGVGPAGERLNGIAERKGSL
jgi:hypothetical protein